jgi:hypothetical protein
MNLCEQIRVTQKKGTNHYKLRPMSQLSKPKLYRQPTEGPEPQTPIPSTGQKRKTTNLAASTSAKKPYTRKTAEEERKSINFTVRILNDHDLLEVMRNQPVRERNQYGAHFDIPGRVKAVHYNLAFKQENQKFVLSDKQLASVIGSNWKRTWDHVRAPGYGSQARLPVGGVAPGAAGPEQLGIPGGHVLRAQPATAATSTHPARGGVQAEIGPCPVAA